MYSIAILLSCLEFLNKVNNSPQEYSKFISRKTYIYTTPSIILNNLKIALLINIKEGYIYINDNSRKYIIKERIFSIKLNDNKLIKLLKELLKECLIAERFYWLYYLYQGRFECLNRIKDFATKRSIVLVLYELNLLKETDEEAINWWSNLEKAYNVDKNEIKIKLEKLEKN